MATLPSWLDLADERVHVHADVPMRQYLQVEQDLGVRLPGEGNVAPRYRSTAAAASSGHVVLVTTSSKPNIKDYGRQNFSRSPGN